MKVSLPLLGFSWQGLGFCESDGCGCLGLSGLNLTEGVALGLSSIGSQVGGGGGGLVGQVCGAGVGLGFGGDLGADIGLGFGEGLGAGIGLGVRTGQRKVINSAFST